MLIELLQISKYRRKPTPCNCRSHLQAIHNASWDFTWLLMQVMERKEKFSEWQLISSSLKPDTWLPHYYVFASTTQYWFDLSGYQPYEHLIKELTSVLKPNRRASKSKNSWWGTQQSVWESWHLNLRGAGHPGLMKRWVTKKPRWWRRQRDISAWVSLQLSSLCHPQFTELCPELKAQVLLLPQSQKLLPHPYLPAPQLSTTHQAALSAPHVALKWPELMRNIGPLLLNSAQTHASDSFSLLSFVSAATITFFFLMCCLGVITLQTAKRI